MLTSEHLIVLGQPASYPLNYQLGWLPVLGLHVGQAMTPRDHLLTAWTCLMNGEPVGLSKRGW
jgi:hypothetical protein